jgi:hypothetical protein
MAKIAKRIISNGNNIEKPAKISAAANRNRSLAKAAASENIEINGVMAMQLISMAKAYNVK